MRAFFQLMPYLKSVKWLVIASLVLSLPLSALATAPVALVKYLVDELLIDRNPSLLQIVPGALIGIYVLNFFVRFLHYYLIRLSTARVNQKVKNDLYDHIMGLSADYFTTQKTGALISRVGADPNFLDGGIASIGAIFRESFKFFFLMASALYLNWRLTLITIVIFPFLAWLFSAVGRNMKRYINRMAEENANIFSGLQESFNGFRIVKTFRLEKYLREKFKAQVDQFFKFYLKTAAVEEASHPMVELLTGIAIAAVVYFGGGYVLANQMTPGGLLAFFTAFALMMDPIRRLNDVNVKLNQAAGACQRIFDVLSWKSKISEVETPKKLDEFKDSIEFQNISFSYPDEPSRKILKDVSFKIEKGKVVALVGASGSGKTSIANLVPRIFDVTDGRILIDGQDIRELSVNDLRNRVAVVSQDVFLFNDTVAENIRCGKLDATPMEIQKAAERAHAVDFIHKLSNGFQTVIGDRGIKLSGGERQRISIARAFLRDAPILVLDEATSSLDTQSEKEVQKAIDELMTAKTTLVIAHRLSTIQNADSIIVLKEGQIVESGCHEELMEISGEYAHFQRLGNRNTETGLGF